MRLRNGRPGTHVIDMLLGVVVDVGDAGGGNGAARGVRNASNEAGTDRLDWEDRGWSNIRAEEEPEPGRESGWVVSRKLEALVWREGGASVCVESGPATVGVESDDTAISMSDSSGKALQLLWLMEDAGVIVLGTSG